MSNQIANFMLGDTTLGVDILLVKEVHSKLSLTPIPDAPKQIRGLMNLRGKVVTVVDLNVCLNRPPAESTERNRLLILKTDEEIIPYQLEGKLEKAKLGDDIVGFLIDRMDDILEVDDGDILPPPPNMETVEEGMIEGVIKHGNELILLLDVTGILNEVLASVSS